MDWGKVEVDFPLNPLARKEIVGRPDPEQMMALSYIGVECHFCSGVEQKTAPDEQAASL